MKKIIKLNEFCNLNYHTNNSKETLYKLLSLDEEKLKMSSWCIMFNENFKMVKTFKKSYQVYKI